MPKRLTTASVVDAVIADVDNTVLMQLLRENPSTLKALVAAATKALEEQQHGGDTSPPAISPPLSPSAGRHNTSALVSPATPRRADADNDNDNDMEDLTSDVNRNDVSNILRDVRARAQLASVNSSTHSLVIDEDERAGDTRRVVRVRTRPADIDDSNDSDTDFEPVVNKKTERRRNRPNNHSSDHSGAAGASTSTPTTRSTNNNEAAPKTRDLTVFMKGCHRSIAVYATENWKEFERTFNVKFHSPASFKVTGHCIKIVCSNPAQKDLLQTCEEICGEAVKVTLPYGLTRQTRKLTKKFVIHNVPTAFTDDDIKSAAKVVSAKRIISRKNCMAQPTKVVILDIEGKPPVTVNIGSLVFKLKDYIPRPVRCARCNSFNHRQDQCTQKQHCVRCSSDQHTFDNCPVKDQRDQYKCKNCGGPHSAAFRGCPVYKEMQDILKAKTRNRTTFAEAAKEVRKSKEPQSCTGTATATDQHDTQTTTKTSAIAGSSKRGRRARKGRKKLNFEPTGQTNSEPGQPEEPKNMMKETAAARSTDARPNNDGNAARPEKAGANADANMDLLATLYALSNHVICIATDSNYSRLMELHMISVKLFNMGQRLYGKTFEAKFVDWKKTDARVGQSTSTNSC